VLAGRVRNVGREDTDLLSQMLWMDIEVRGGYTGLQVDMFSFAYAEARRYTIEDDDVKLDSMNTCLLLGFRNSSSPHKV
jgi:hypothetical protein